MRLRFWSWACVLGIGSWAGVSAAQQFTAQQFANPYAPARSAAPAYAANAASGPNSAAPRGSYYAQVARQAGIAAPLSGMNAAGGPSAPSQTAAHASLASRPALSAPPSLPVAYPATPPAVSAPLPNPYLSNSYMSPPPAAAAPITVAAPTAPKTYRALSALNGVQQVTWLQPRSFMQARNAPPPAAPKNVPTIQQAPTGGIGPQQAPVAGSRYGAAVFMAANQPTLAPPRPDANALVDSSATYPGFSPNSTFTPGAPMAGTGPTFDAPAFANPSGVMPMAPGGVTTTPGGAPSVWRPNSGGTFPQNAPQNFAGPQNYGAPQNFGVASPADFAADPNMVGPNMAGPNFAGPQVAGPGFNGAGYNGPVYDGMFEEGAAAPSSNWFQPNMGGGGCQSCGPWFFALSGLYMTRDAPNNVGLTFVNTEPNISILNTETAGFDWHGGFETRFGRTLGSNYALEADYWYLDPTSDAISTRSLGNGISSRLDLSQVLFNGFALSNIYENSREQRIYRGNSFQNMELNLWQQALNVDPSGRFGMAFFTGVRYFRYREILEYGAVQAGSEFSDNDVNTQSWYHIRMRNNLIGWQLGGRGQMFLGPKLRLFAVPRAGVFANVISQQQDLCMVIDLRSQKTDVALMGQIDLGVAYQLFNCCSMFMSYRAMGIAGVANADDQIGRDFTSQADLAQINSSGSIILHGLNAGLQYQF